jgi:hypothetical protein
MSTRTHRNILSPKVDSMGTVRCRNSKCKRVLGRVQLGTLTVGGVILWNEVQYSCASCGTAYRYTERRADGRSLSLGSAVLGVEGESRQRLIYETLNSLGHDPVVEH